MAHARKLLVDDPKKPWSGIAYVSALLTVVATGWAIGHWLIVIVPWSVFAVALVLWSDDAPLRATAIRPAGLEAQVNSPVFSAWFSAASWRSESRPEPENTESP